MIKTLTKMRKTMIIFGWVGSTVHFTGMGTDGEQSRYREKTYKKKNRVQYSCYVVFRISGKT